MEMWLLWLAIGFGLVIVELLTGTFYLLVIGVGFFAAALCAYFAPGAFIVQAFVGSVVAILGGWLVHHWHASQRTKDAGRSNMLDRGQAVVLEGWANENAGIARVRYRGASWDARVAAGAARPETGSTLYIEGQEGSTLIVATSRPQ